MSLAPVDSTSPISPSLMTVAPLPEVEAVQDILGTMKGALAALGMTFDSLGEQTSRVAALGPVLENANQINALRKHIQNQDIRQEQKIEEIKALLKEVLQHEIVEHLRNKVAEHINDAIEEQVRSQVQYQLTYHIPETLQEQVSDQKRQLNEVKRALFNSESRRANALLRSNHLNEPLRPLYMSNGEISASYPKDLPALFALDGKSNCQATTRRLWFDGLWRFKGEKPKQRLLMGDAMKIHAVLRRSIPDGAYKWCHRPTLGVESRDTSCLAAVDTDSAGNPHLVLFQTLSQSLRDNPTEVTAQLSAWICDPSSPRFWAPFAFSVRGLAYELMDEWDLARLDYTRGLRLYDSLEQELGSQTVKRMQTNVAFMKFRLQMLPPPKKSGETIPDYVVIDEDGPLF